eukprot:11805651-Ditylum_brightwellii.AAC.1
MALEIKALNEMERFDFRDSHPLQRLPKDNPSHGGHLVDILDNEIYLSNTKDISVKLQHDISQNAGLDALCRDIGNVYINTHTKEKVHAVEGPELGPGLEGKIGIIYKALYELATSCVQFHAHLSDTLRGIEFRPTRFDHDMWIRLGADKKSYEYICTHIDDFCIFSKQTDDVMAQIKVAYRVKLIGPPKYYLGNDFKCNSK